MKNLIFTAALTIFALSFFGQLSAQGKQQSLLWEISGNGLKQNSYLYGTVHMICESDFVISEKAKNALNSSARVTFEIDYSNNLEMEAFQKSALSEVPLDQQLSPQKYAELDKILMEKFGAPAKQFNHLNMTTLVSLSWIKSYGCSTFKMYESEFMKMAIEKNIAVSGLETVAHQIEMMKNAYTEARIFQLLQNDKEQIAITTDMVAKYKKEDLLGLYHLLTKDMTPQEIKIMLTDRNHVWAEIIPKIIEKERNFIAVGAAHLEGTQGIINLLQQQGFTVKPIMN